MIKELLHTFGKVHAVFVAHYPVRIAVVVQHPCSDCPGHAGSLPSVEADLEFSQFWDREKPVEGTETRFIKTKWKCCTGCAHDVETSIDPE